MSLELSQVTKIVMDIPPSASASTATLAGVGVCFDGYDRALCIGVTAAGDDSNATFSFGVYVDSDCTVPSDCTYGAFGTDATIAAAKYDSGTSTSDSTGYHVIDLDLKGEGETSGCISTRFTVNGGAGSNTASCASVIILYNGSGFREQPTVAGVLTGYSTIPKIAVVGRYS